MHHLFKFWLLFILIFTYISSSFGQTGCMPVDLKCEFHHNPLGIDRENPRLSWHMEDLRRGANQTAYRIQVASDSMALANGQANIWDTGKLTSGQSANIQYDGDQLASRTKYYWRVIVWDLQQIQSAPSAIATFETGFLHGLREWKGAWISDGKDIDYKPAPYFRKTFNIKGKIASARAYICGLGYFELSLNGNKVGDHLLDPGYTSFDKTVLYQTFDITGYLNSNENAIGVVLGNGWYNEQSKAVWYFDKAPWRERPKFILNIYIKYENGQEDLITSDTSWKTSSGPIIFNNIYSGEYYDARLEHAGWNTANFDDHNWENAKLAHAQSGKLLAQSMPPIRITKVVKPVKMVKINDTTYVYHMGINFAGLSQLTVSGQHGTMITLKHGEALYPDGRLDNKNISVHYRFEDSTEVAQTDRYILKGEGTEVYMPRFTYHGFRYVEVTSSKPVQLTINSLKGYQFHTDIERVGHFSCSNPLMNRIYEAGLLSYVSNLEGIPTDCPHREKNGWTGDGHIGAETGLFNYDGILLYEKWIRDFRDAQRGSGELPGIIPTSGWGYHWGNGPAWDSGLILIPYYLYLHYGDEYLITTYYENFKRYVDYLTFRSHDNLVDIGLGDWQPYKTETPVELTSSCYYYIDTHLLAKFARITGHAADELYYTQLAENIKTAINQKFLNSSNDTYANGSQTALSAALYQGVVPGGKLETVGEKLEVAVHANDDHLDVGLLGSKYLLNALTEAGDTELAYRVASQETKPSWGWWLLQGETTFQESWDLGPSRNHIMYGEIVAWMFKALAGINPDPEHPGFKNIIIKPGIVPGLNNVQASHQSVYGTIVSDWEKTRKGARVHLTIPANSTATIYLPVSEKQQVYESGQKLLSSTGQITLVSQNGGKVVYKVMAGDYYFEIK